MRRWIGKLRCFSGELLPPRQDHVAIFRIDLHAEAASAVFFAGDEGCSCSAEQVDRRSSFWAECGHKRLWKRSGERSRVDLGELVGPLGRYVENILDRSAKLWGAADCSGWILI